MVNAGVLTHVEELLKLKRTEDPEIMGAVRELLANIAFCGQTSPARSKA